MANISEADYDLSGKAGNPTSALQSQYQKLMTIQDPDELVNAAQEVVSPLVGHGMSETNYKKFVRNLMQARERGLVGLQHFLSNYILAGSGLSVGRGRGFARENVEIEQIASMISEDVNVVRQFTAEQLRLKQLVESCTNFKVFLSEEAEGGI